MVHDPLNRPLLLQVPDGHPRETPVDLEPLDEDALADEAEGRDLLQDTVIGSLVEDDGVLRLVLDLALGPLLLLCSLAAGGRCGCCLSLGLRNMQLQSACAPVIRVQQHPSKRKRRPSGVEYTPSHPLGAAWTV